MTIAATCGNCGRELLLSQLTNSFDGFRCPNCGEALAPSYAMAAPGVTARLLDAHAELVASVGLLHAMTGTRLRLDRASLVDPVEEQLGSTTPTG